MRILLNRFYVMIEKYKLHLKLHQLYIFKGKQFFIVTFHFIYGTLKSQALWIYYGIVWHDVSIDI